MPIIAGQDPGIYRRFFIRSHGSASTSQGASTDGQYGQTSSVQNHHRHMRLSSQREKNDSACKSSLTYQKSQASERVSKSKAPRQYSNEKKKKRWKEKDDDRFLALIQFKTA